MWLTSDLVCQVKELDNPEHHRGASENWRHRGQLAGYCCNSGVSGNETGNTRLDRGKKADVVYAGLEVCSERSHEREGPIGGPALASPSMPLAPI